MPKIRHVRGFDFVRPFSIFSMVGIMLPLVLLPLLALYFKPVLPAWGFMWAMAFAIFL